MLELVVDDDLDDVVVETKREVVVEEEEVEVEEEEEHEKVPKQGTMKNLMQRKFQYKFQHKRQRNWEDTENLFFQVDSVFRNYLKQRMKGDKLVEDERLQHDEDAIEVLDG